MAERKPSLLLNKALDSFADDEPRKSHRERPDPRKSKDEDRDSKKRRRDRQLDDRCAREDRRTDRDKGRHREPERWVPPACEGRLGRGGRPAQSLAEKRRPGEVARARGRDTSTRGTLSSRPRTVRVTNIHPIVDLDSLVELFQRATGKITDSSLENGTALLTFEETNSASKARFEFDGGQVADQKIKVEFVYDDESDSDDGWQRV